jgi:hypothetical protein
LNQIAQPTHRVCLKTTRKYVVRRFSGQNDKLPFNQSLHDDVNHVTGIIAALPIQDICHAHACLPQILR